MHNFLISSSLISNISLQSYIDFWVIILTFDDAQLYYTVIYLHKEKTIQRTKNIPKLNVDNVHIHLCLFLHDKYVGGST
jgi:hypothetical protein